MQVLVQYAATIDAGKLKSFVHQLAQESSKPLPRSKINIRMVPEATSHELTGYGHNAVTPICSATRIPILMSDRITQLTGHFFLGAGEVDLKVGMPAAEFVRAFVDVPVFVVDCTS